MLQARGIYKLKVNLPNSAKSTFLMDQVTTSEKKHNLRFHLVSVLLILFAALLLYKLTFPMSDG